MRAGNRSFAVFGSLFFQFSAFSVDFSRRALGQRDEHRHHQNGSKAEKILPREARVQPERRAQRRADRLGAGEQACAHAADVAHALQIKRECKRRADNGDFQRAECHRGVERDRNPPRLREHEQHHAADEHPAARADAHGIAPKQVARQERIEHQRHRRAQAPEERLRRERERGQAAMGRKQKSAEEREHERDALAPRRQAARTQAHPKQNECLPHILQHCGGRTVGVTDGCEVGILAGHQSADGEEHEPQRVAPVRPNGPKLRAVPYERAAEQHHAGQKHPHHGQPSAVHALTGEEILSHRTGRAPAHAAERRAQKAAQRPLFFVHTRPPAIIFAHCSRPCAAFQAPCASLHIFPPRVA